MTQINESLTNAALSNSPTTAAFSKEEVLRDYRIGWESRHASLIGRKEVFMGKAKFGIFGDGKEVPQLALAKAFRKGDFRSGYYRDQTFMLALGELTLEQYFAQLYAHTSVEAEPASGGRQMNGHFATRSLDENGNWKDLTAQYNSSADISPTAGQMPRLVGLGLASKFFRQNPELAAFPHFSNKGNEVAFGTIGDASTSEGHFWESLNAIGVLQVPVVMSVWDDGYGISVPKKYQTIKESISEALIGFQRTEEKAGFEIFKVKAWDYPAICKVYKDASLFSRLHHIPVLIHVEEVTQPQGHSTSGSHERYKTKERLEWEREYDCLVQMRKFILSQGLATAEELEYIEKAAQNRAKEARNNAWNAFVQDMKPDHESALFLIESAKEVSTTQKESLAQIHQKLAATLNPMRADAVEAVKAAIYALRFERANPYLAELRAWVKRTAEENFDRYSSHLYCQTERAALKVEEIKPIYSQNSPTVDGREVLQACFKAIFENNPLAVAFGEDVGRIGDVNQAFAGLQEIFGEIRISDTGIREATIMGQGIGLAMRGLRPIAEIQYLDYLLYGLQTLSDDLATVRYRTKNGQHAPMIIRTRGHRLEGIWHSGSPIGMILNALRGVYVAVPRNMTQAAGFYNTFMKSDDPALIIECLNGYRLKEQIPNNIGEFTVPLGVPEVLRQGSDITVVTYGSMCRVVMAAAEQLAKMDIEIEVIDVQTLIPFDRAGVIIESLRKTNRIIFADEDVSAGATAYMMAKVLDENEGYFLLDSKPICVAAQDHRPPYASDGDYFTKPNIETVVEAAYALMHEANPALYPSLY
ncbi:alpha-ketoacid dehydrogenase subunit alpha/beta [Hugenholtzia roseola]|uniref:alpha-ketoacid dehydrogenase subunit alpha/beta n=1 Tax=Hugenholtzia roseola TaxID=1002 RepID=UPI0003F666FD|nr:alpha-ketoacid dehydrogenase subunit alpha/beta [Hugenholtzia roseola]